MERPEFENQAMNAAISRRGASREKRRVKPEATHVRAEPESGMREWK